MFKVIDHMPGAYTRYVHTTVRYIVNFNMITMIISIATFVYHILIKVVHDSSFLFNVVKPKPA